MNIDRTIRYVLLTLLLLLSQQMGISHAVSHLSVSHSSQTDEPLPLEKACDQCLAFAAIGSALTGNYLPDLAQGLPAIVFAIIPGTLYFPVIVYAFQSRAPPLAI